MNYGDDILGYLNKKRVVKQWLKEKYKTKPLIIYGQSGTGKTKLAEYISKDYIPIIIDIEFCKKKQCLNDYLKLSLYKKSITMMFDKHERKKMLILDDLKYIQSNDKNLFKQICDFSKKHNGFHVIYIFQNVNHKSIKSIYKKCFPINIDLNYNQIKELLIKYYDVKNKNLKELIEKSNYNFHNININLEFYKNNTNQINTYDKKYDDLFEIIDKISNSTNMDEIYRNVFSDYSIISLNILENLPNWIFNSKINPKKHINIITTIYKSFTIGDTLFKKLPYYNDFDFYHNITFTILNPIMIINKYSLKMEEKVYNKYLSRSIIYTFNNRLLNNYNINTFILSKLYSLFYTYEKNQENYSELINYINKYSINIKIIEKFSKYFDYDFSKNLFKNINNNNIVINNKKVEKKIKNKKIKK